MPNHCSNTLGVLGKTEDVEKFVAFVTNNGPDKEEVFSHINKSVIDKTS